MTQPIPTGGPGRVAMVLAGGSARGAYEVGVVQHILEDVSRDLGRDVPIDILCGTSVGALNASLLAAFADQPRARAKRLVDYWRGLRLADVVHPDPRALLDLVRGLFGRDPTPDPRARRRGGVLNPEPLERLVRASVPFGRITSHLRSGHLYALTISTTHVRSGRTVVFVERQGGGVPYWGNDPTIVARGVSLTPDHALASAAIPFLFPAVRLHGEFYCDGGLRQNVPLSPARRLGADRLVVISPRYVDTRPLEAVPAAAGQDFPGPLFLLGKALNALLLDRVDNDIDRLHRINRLLDAGVRRYGEEFIPAINQELGEKPSALRTRQLKVVLIRTSQDIAHLAAEFVRSRRFNVRASGLTGRAMRRIADSAFEADLLSYLLFDGEFAADLIALGREDARAQHDALCALFEERLAATP